MHQSDVILQKLGTLVSADQIVPWEQEDHDLWGVEIGRSGIEHSGIERSGIERSETEHSQIKHSGLRASVQQAIAPAPNPACAVYPRSPDELSDIMACAHRHGWTVLPYGAGTKLHWGGLAESADILISTARLNRVIDHAIDDLTITVEAGCTYAQIQALLAPSRQFLAIDPSYPDRATVGGMVATADAGFWRQRYGGVRDRVIGISFVRSDGALSKAGGRVVKNVAGYDLMKLMTGSWGSLGIITQLTLRLYPQPETSKTMCVVGPADRIGPLVAQTLASSLTPTAFAIAAPGTVGDLAMAGLEGQIEARPDASNPDLMVIVRFQSLAASVTQQAEQLGQGAQQQQLKMQTLIPDQESRLWSHLAQQRSPRPTDATVVCKVGVPLTVAVDLLQHCLHPDPQVKGWINAGSGLGLLQWSADAVSLDELKTVRSRCEAEGGFLTLLQAPLDWKQAIDPWGYAGNALPMMQRLKQKFDPERQLSPGRFVGGL